MPVMQNNAEKTFRSCHITGRQYEQGSVFEFDIHTFRPAGTSWEAALYLLLEHRCDTMAPLLCGFMREGLIPPGMIVFCNPGSLPPSLPGGEKRNMRAEEFDQFGAEFSNFLVEELIPEACRTADMEISSSPDMHFICGGSSGGMAAWNAVWFRNDFFRRAFLSSPTFSAMRGGEEAMVLVRKTEAKPIRLYMTAGTEEPDYFFGSSLLTAQNAAAALEFAGYDFRFEQFNGEGHSCRREDPTLWRRMMFFLWANWRTVPVAPLGSQIRIRNLVADGSAWEQYDGCFPAKEPLSVNGGVYSFEGGSIVFTKNGIGRTVAEGFGRITALGLSSDRWRLYIADESRRFVFAMSIMPDGSLKNRGKLAPLHLAHDFRKAGAADITVLADDRILVATELGVQGIVSFGLTDLILPLPGDLPAEKITVRGTALYVASGDRIFLRRLKISASAPDDGPRPPATPAYSDGFNYNRSHLFFS